MFWTLEGELQLVRTTADGASAVLQRSRHGLLAEGSLFSERYHCDGVALCDTSLILISQPRFLAAFSDADFARAYAQWLSGTVRELRSACERLSLRRAPDRIAHYLETHGEFFYGRGGGTLKDWAMELGLAHESLYRSLTAMEEAGMVERDGESVRLRNSDAKTVERGG